MPSFRIWSLRLQAGRDRVYGPLADRRTVLSFLKCQVVRDALLDFGADLLEVESAERVLVSPCLQAPLFAVGPVLLSNVLGPLALDCCTGLQYSWKIHDHNRRPGGGRCPEDRRSDFRDPPNPSPRRRRQIHDILSQTGQTKWLQFEPVGEATAGEMNSIVG